MAATFTEVQKFTEVWWTWLLVIGITLLIIWVGYRFFRFYRSKQENVNPVFMGFLCFFLLLPIALNVLLLTGNLTTSIDKEGVSYSYFPFSSKDHIKWQDIDTVYTRQYNPTLEYGGWGLKGRAGNSALNVYGDMGIQILFKNGKKLLLGTQRPGDAQMALTTCFHH